MVINSKTGCLAVGGSKDSGKYKELGSKQTPVLEFSLAVGKDEKNNTVWVNCKAWNPVASRFKDKLIKGEKYLASGQWEKREHNGKEYITLVVDFMVGMLMAVTDMPGGNNSLAAIGTDDDIPDFLK